MSKYKWHCYRCGIGLIDEVLIKEPKDSICLPCHADEIEQNIESVSQENKT